MLTLLAALLTPQTIDQKALDALVQRCAETGTHRLVVMVAGKVVVDKSFANEPGPIESMSATKSVVNIAVGMLIKEGKIKGVDQPVRDFFPTYKHAVTIRHLLDHTSGIEVNRTTEDIYSSDDFVKNALEKPLKTPPGARYFYNNRAVNLLAGVVGKAAGERMDKYLKRKLFAPLGIKEFRWTLDKAGNPHGMSGFQVLPTDFAKIGNFVLNGGNGLLPPNWIADSTRPSPASLRAGDPCGWLWWPKMENQGYGVNAALLETWKAAGMRQDLIDRYATLNDKIFPTLPALYRAMNEAFKDYKGVDDSNDYFTSGKVSAAVRLFSGGVTSYSAQGYLGQYLVIVPSARLVAVRMRKPWRETEEESRKNTFSEFPTLVDALGRGDKPR